MAQPKYLKIDTKHNSYLFDGVLSKIIDYSQSKEKIIMNFFSMSKEAIFSSLRNQNWPYEEKEFEYDYNLIGEMIEEGCFFNYKYRPKLTEKQLNDIILKSPSSNLVLSVTEDCNMRCKYCLYSELYENSVTYSKQNMSWEIAKKSVDQYFELHNEKEKRGYKKSPSITFFGGEPLIQYKLIKKVIEYASGVREDTRFYITTNGLLLSQKVIDFFINHDVFITFSLDGYKANHDRNRVLENGNPTFDKIFSNIQKLQQQKNNISKPQMIAFNCCFDKHVDFEKVVNFFVENYELFDPFICSFAPIIPYETSYFDWVENQINDGKLDIRNISSKDSLKKIRDYVLSNEILSMDESFKKKYLSIAGTLVIKELLQDVQHPDFHQLFNHSCTPMDKLHVHTDGSYTICEKMAGKLPVGNIDTGIDYSQLKEVANAFLDFVNDKCYNCPVASMCNVCFMYMNEDMEISNQVCKDQFTSIVNTLEKYLECKEIDYDFEGLYSVTGGNLLNG